MAGCEGTARRSSFAEPAGRSSHTVRSKEESCPVRIGTTDRGEAALLQVVRTGGSCRSFANLLNGWEEQANQDRDDRDHDEQLDERERLTSVGRESKHWNTLSQTGI